MNRINEWLEFNEKMLVHLKTYADVQYGNSEGNEQVDGFSTEDCWQNMQRYYNRRNSSVRGSIEKLRDSIKVAHYAQLIFDKLRKELKEDIYTNGIK